MRIPSEFPVKVLKPSDKAKEKRTCGVCGRSWDDAIPTTWTPTPSGRCPFEYFHSQKSDSSKATTKVIYHSVEWERLVTAGWITAYVTGNIATMVRE